MTIAILKLFAGYSSCWSNGRYYSAILRQDTGNLEGTMASNSGWNQSGRNQHTDSSGNYSWESKSGFCGHRLSTSFENNIR